MEKKKKDTLLLIDANSLIHRAFHALPALTTPDGESAGALYGVASILIKIFKERPPHYTVAAFDHPEPTFREKEYAEYKATREKTPDDLVSQIIEAHTLLKQFNIKVLDVAGWEADDILATLAKKYKESGDVQVVIFSGDLDMLQSVDGKRVVVETPQKGISNTVVYDEEGVIERFGVPPHKLNDFKGLVGDTSDNIPGVPGIGPKTAAMLLANYESLEDMYKDVREVGMTNKKLWEKLIQNEKQAFLSKKLATLDASVPIDVELEEIEIDNQLNKANLIKYLEKLGFDSLVSRIVGGDDDGYNGVE